MFLDPARDEDDHALVELIATAQLPQSGVRDVVDSPASVTDSSARGNITPLRAPFTTASRGCAAAEVRTSKIEAALRRCRNSPPSAAEIRYCGISASTKNDRYVSA